MPSFETLPPEIRHQVYSYLLLDNGVVQLDRSKDFLSLRPNFQTAIFRINKAISAEAINYFHRQNAFVAVTLPYTSSPWGTHCFSRYSINGGLLHSFGHQDFIPRFQCWCPIHIFHNIPEHRVLAMKVTFESSEDFPWKTYDCIVSARHFPLFSRLINIYVRFVLSECNVPVSSSEIVSTAHYLDISPVNRASIIEGLKRLGPALILDQDLTKSTIQFQSNQAIWGSESSATRPLSLLSKLALADLLGIAEDVGALFEQGRFRQVVHICDAAGHLVFTPAELYTPLTPQEKHQRLRAILHMEMIKCLSFTKLGEMEAAFECAFDTHVEFSGRERSNAHWQDPSSRQNIDLIANGLTDYGRLGAIEQVISSYRTKLRPLIRDRHPDFYDESRVMFEKLCKFQTHLWPDTVTDDMWSLDEPSTEPIKVRAP